MRAIWEAESGAAYLMKTLFVVMFLIALVGYVTGGFSHLAVAAEAGAAAAAAADDDDDDDDDDDKGAPGKKDTVTGEQETVEGKEVTFLDNLKQSGVIGLVLLVLSIFMVALIVNNLLLVRRSVLLPASLLDQFEGLLKEKKYPEAYQLARENNSFAGRVLAAGLSKLAGGYGKAIEAMQEIGEEENMRMEQRLSYLAMIGTVAPMLGLLGTVSGMVSSFNVIASSATQPKPNQLAGGISMALMTTLIGLSVAIPAIIAFGFLRNRVSRLVLEVGIVTEEMMSRFSGVPSGQQQQGS